jgi:hypothetical protein
MKKQRGCDVFDCLAKALSIDLYFKLLVTYDLLLTTSVASASLSHLRYLL